MRRAFRAIARLGILAILASQVHARCPRSKSVRHERLSVRCATRAMDHLSTFSALPWPPACGCACARRQRADWTRIRPRRPEPTPGPGADDEPLSGGQHAGLRHDRPCSDSGPTTPDALGTRPQARALGVPGPAIPASRRRAESKADARRGHHQVFPASNGGRGCRPSISWGEGLRTPEVQPCRSSPRSRRCDRCARREWRWRVRTRRELKFGAGADGHGAARKGVGDVVKRPRGSGSLSVGWAPDFAKLDADLVRSPVAARSRRRQQARR